MTFDRSQIPPGGSPRVFNFPEFERFTLSNGLEVLFAPHNKLPLVTFQLINKRGALTEDEAQTGITAVTTDMLMEGTRQKSVLEFSSALEFLAISMNTSTNWDASYFSVNCLKKHIGKSIDLFGEALFSPAFATEELERQKKQLINNRIAVKDNPSALASEMFAAALFPDTRYARPLNGFTRHIKKFEKSQLNKTHRNNFQPQNSALVIVGDLSRAEVDRNFLPLLDSWTPQPIDGYNHVQIKTNSDGAIILLNKPGAKQAQIRVGHLGVERKANDYFDAMLMNEIFGGYFMSRLNMNLREDKGFTYGINSRYYLRKTAVPFVISAAVDAEKVLPALEEILLEMYKMQDTNVSEKELNEARGYLSGIFPVAFENSSQIAGGLSNIELYGLEDDYYRRFRTRLNNVTISTVRCAAEKYLHPNTAVVVIVADKTVVEADLSKRFPQLQVMEISND